MDHPLIVASRLEGDGLRTSEYEVLDLVCDGPFDYWSGLASVWGSDQTVVNVERDMEFSDDLVRELLSCPQPLCAFPYRVLPSGWPGFLYSAAFRDWVSEGTDFASFSAIGFCKITPEARSGSELERKSWEHLETGVHNAVAHGKRFWHLHWPEIVHYHDYPAEPDAEASSLLRIIEQARAEGRLFVHGADPSTEDLKACDPFLYNESLRSRVKVLSHSRPDA